MYKHKYSKHKNLKINVIIIHNAFYKFKINKITFPVGQGSQLTLWGPFLVSLYSDLHVQEPKKTIKSKVCMYIMFGLCKAKSNAISVRLELVAENLPSDFIK